MKILDELQTGKYRVRILRRATHDDRADGHNGLHDAALEIGEILIRTDDACRDLPRGRGGAGDPSRGQQRHSCFAIALASVYDMISDSSQPPW
jgi:hypothetical protein